MPASLIEFTLVSICPSGYSTSGSTEMSEKLYLFTSCIITITARIDMSADAVTEMIFV